jgi:hypothetical protein
VKGGRFYALPGYEDGPAPARPLLSTSYMFSYAHPFTHFGIMSTWHVTDQLNLYNGVVNGWDRWIDRSFKWGYAGAASYDSADDRTNLTVTFNWGPNQFPNFFPANFQLAPNGVTQPPFLAGRRNLGFQHNDTILFTEILVHEWTKKLTVIGESDQGFTNNVPGAGPGGTFANSAWFGLGGWLLYNFTDKLTGVARAEWFRDQNGVRTGFDDAFYETTLGLIYRPCSWFWVRPEVRFDWATGPDKPFINDTSRNQFTFGFDAIFLF